MADEVTAPEGEAAGAESVEKTLTQGEVDKIVQDRLARERAKFADYDDLKAKVNASKSDAEKAVEAARAEGEKVATDRFQARLFESEVKARAAALKFRDPADALSVFGDRDGLVGADGAVDVKALDERLSSIANDKPYLVDTPPQVAKRPTLKSRGTTNSEDQAKPSKAADALRAFAAGR